MIPHSVCSYLNPEKVEGSLHNKHGVCFLQRGQYGERKTSSRCGETWQPSLNQGVKINTLLQQKSAILIRRYSDSICSLVQVRRACLAFGVLISVLPHDSDIKQMAIGSHFYLISDHDSLRLARFHKHRDMLRNCHFFPQRGACKSSRRLSVVSQNRGRRSHEI